MWIVIQVFHQGLGMIHNYLRPYVAIFIINEEKIKTKITHILCPHLVVFPPPPEGK